MSPTRRDVLKWGVGAGGAATAAALGLPATARAGSGFNDPSWMGRLPNSTLLARLTIPGTHDSWCTDPSNGTEWAHTQNWGIPEQLERGIRFLDIRCNGLQGAPNEFGLYHGAAYQHHRYQDVLDVCRNFLRQSPGETIIMRLKNENAGGQALGPEEFRRRFNYYMDNMGYRSLFWTAPSWPALGQVRGKIVLAADFANEWGILNWTSGTPDKNYFKIQDEWNAPNSAAKVRFITKWFDAAYYDQKSYEPYVNFTSYSADRWPKLNASQVLPDVFQYLNARRDEKIHLGIVPMDFPDFNQDVVRLLVEKNFVR
ncbi:phosphatidylinositol-specific phospholipase C [Streptomyces sp. ISL-11]|uniref:phosphatidylinositol-specific phospholipase C n=1 Tax=Streptomyces sp. ISL-11 TaxID=2819174 RepID=UPI001BE7B1FA|nr:phosphatidylinositol-specific phospholipase C [Streptomyces sp. ISL-11]MBT2382230.1 phosphatidylinositol-specific phospholipase C [Streptomyces sp. ISL-11]